MRKMFLTPLIVCTVSLLFVLLMPVQAMPPTTVSGTWTYTLKPGFPVDTKMADGNTFKYGEETGIWTGTFSGTSEDAFTLVMHPSGFVTCQGLINFDGEVQGNTGTLLIKFVGRRSYDPAGDWSGQWVIIGGTGGLANLRGQGIWYGPPFNLDYSGQIHFSPS